MLVIALSGALIGFFLAATDVILPLWVTGTLGYSDGEWGQMRSLRLAGSAVGAIVLGAAASRIGTRAMTWLCFLAAGLLCMAMAVEARAIVWLLMFLLGAFASTALVNLNVMTQEVTSRRPGVANSIYRSVGAFTAIVAPLAVTALSVRLHGFTAVFWILAACLLAGAWVMSYYPADPPMPDGGGEADAGPWRNYLTLLRDRELMVFLLVSQTWMGLLLGVTTFAAIRFTRDLAMPVETYGLLIAASGALTFVGTVGAATFLDRVSLRRMHVWVAIVAGAGVMLMGAMDSVPVTAIGLLVALPLGLVVVAPTSMWIARLRPAADRVAVFSLYKIVSALCVCLTTLVLALAAPRIGLRLLFLYDGAFALALGLLFFVFKDPGIAPAAREPADVVPVEVAAGS